MKIKLFTVPNLLTLSNLLCGAFASLAALVYGSLEWAFWLIVLAAVFDFFDGFVARLLKCPSAIGVELDSLADMVSFGFAPSAVVYAMTVGGMAEGTPVWIRLVATFVCFVMAAFSALRLAKFNIDETQHTEFCGLPTPANALFFSSLGFIGVRTGLDFGGWPLLIVVVAMSWLLVSPVRMFALKFRGFGWRGNQIRYLFLLLCVAVIASLRIYAIPVIILLYILISAIRWGMQANRGGQEPAEAQAAEERTDEEARSALDDAPKAE